MMAGLARMPAVVLVTGIVMAADTSRAQQAPSGPPASLYDRRLDDLRVASVTWDVRTGPPRKVVDQVCLVPDFPTFLAAISTWDRGRFFPVLLDDAELALKFLRAFRPSRVVRVGKAAVPIPAEKRWEAAITAVGQSWSAPSPVRGEAIPGDAVPKKLGQTPPGVVVSSPTSPTLAGAVALAAGRFQPLIRWDTDKRASDILSDDEARRLSHELEAKVIAVTPKCDLLGDDCDFLTLAGDWPYKALAAKGPQPGMGAFDDRLARVGDERRRWAFVGRLAGDEAAGVYQAMCSLFLQPESALLFNGYPEAGEPWSWYDMRAAARRLGAVLPTAHRAGPKQGDLAGWHRTFDPRNRYGLLLINTKGSTSTFDLLDNPSQTADVPPTVPAAALVIHSFSAADLNNPDSLAGRWLANGAFAYFGSVNEPYLDAFRRPALVADLIAEGIPLSAAVRQGPSEPFGVPWRLLYVGDPFFRVRPGTLREPRLRGNLEPTWTAYAEKEPPPDAAPDSDKLAWVLKTTFLRAAHGDSAWGDDLLERLLAIRRERLALVARPPYEALVADALAQPRHRTELRAALARIPPGDASPDVRRWLETSRVAELQQALSAGDLPRARRAWAELMASESPAELKGQVTGRVAARTTSPEELRLWHVRLRSALRQIPAGTPTSGIIRAELRRVEGLVEADREKAVGRQ
jgi:hypothetical protein